MFVQPSTHMHAYGLAQIYTQTHRFLLIIIHRNVNPAVIHIYNICYAGRHQVWESLIVTWLDMLHTNVEMHSQQYHSVWQKFTVLFPAFRLTESTRVIQPLCIFWYVLLRFLQTVSHLMNSPWVYFTNLFKVAVISLTRPRVHTDAAAANSRESRIIRVLEKDAAVAQRVRRLLYRQYYLHLHQIIC